MDDERAEALARAIAGFGLPGVPVPKPTSVPDPVWQRLFSGVREQRMTGLAVESSAAGWLALAPGQDLELLNAHRESMAWSLAVERKLVGLAEAFDAEDIGFAVLKGPSVAHTAYAEACLRSFGDLDLLVRTADYARACAALEALGHRRQRPEPRRGFEVRFGKASVHQDPTDGVEVDLHRTLVLGPFGLWIHPEELLDRSEAFVLAGRRIRRLDDTGMLLNVAMHASLGWRPPRLVPLRDLLQVTAVGEVEWDALGRWARAWRLTAVLQHSFATASATLGATLPEEARRLVAGHAPRRESRALAAYTTDRRARGGLALTTIRAVPGLGGKAAYVRALALPDREFLVARSRGDGRASYRRRLMTPIHWMKGGR